jgi:hypothetical protein
MASSAMAEARSFGRAQAVEQLQGFAGALPQEINIRVVWKVRV